MSRVHPDTRLPNKHHTFIRVCHVYTQTHGTPTSTIRSSGYVTCTPRHTPPQQTPDVHQGMSRVHPDTRLPNKHQTFIRVWQVYNQTHGFSTSTRRSSGYVTCTPRHTAPQQAPCVHQGMSRVHPDTRHPNKHHTFIRVCHVYTQPHGTPTITRRSSGYVTCTPRHTAPQQAPDVHQGMSRVHPDTRLPNKHQTFIRVCLVYTQTHGSPTSTRRSSGYVTCTPRHTAPQQAPYVHQGMSRVHPDTRHPNKHQTFIRVCHVHVTGGSPITSTFQIIWLLADKFDSSRTDRLSSFMHHQTFGAFMWKFPEYYSSLARTSCVVFLCDKCTFDTHQLSQNTFISSLVHLGTGGINIKTVVWSWLLLLRTWTHFLKHTMEAIFSFYQFGSQICMQIKKKSHIVVCDNNK